jgi:hypothetical protein
MNQIKLDNNCKNRIKPSMIRDVKTEALLVFARTALERFFKRLDEKQLQPLVGNDANSEYIYDTLRELLYKLQECVVNVDYLIELIQYAKKYPSLKKYAKSEEPLITYYDAMAKRMEHFFPSKTTFMPEFIVICTLSYWIQEEQKSIVLYKFLQDVDYNTLIEKFELYGQTLEDENKTLIIDMHKVSLDIVQTLQATKYKVNRTRVSKTRKNRNKK